MNKHHGWHEAVRHIEYFTKELSQRQDLHPAID